MADGGSSSGHRRSERNNSSQSHRNLTGAGRSSGPDQRASQINGRNSTGAGRCSRPDSRGEHAQAQDTTRLVWLPKGTKDVQKSRWVQREIDGPIIPTRTPEVLAPYFAERACKNRGQWFRMQCTPQTGTYLIMAMVDTAPSLQQLQKQEAQQRRATDQSSRSDESDGDSTSPAMRMDVVRSQ